MNSKFNNSIKFKLSLALGIVISSILIAFIVFVSIKTRHEAIESAERTAIAESHECAKLIQLELNKAIIANRMLCQTFNSVKDKHPDELSRDGVNTILKNTLETFPDLFGAFTVWEPNAFDNKDSHYSNSEESKAGHDTTGRLIPLWYRSIDGEIKLVPIKDYENEQSSAWYYMPQKTGVETIMDPFYYKNVYMISVVNPIIKDGRFLGITGLGMRISFVQDMVNEFDVYNKKGEITILSDAGTIVASSKSLKLAGKSTLENYKIPAGIFTDQQEVVSIHNDTLQAFVPFKLGDSDKTWVAMVQIPRHELMAGSSNLILILLASGLFAIVLLLVGIYFFASRLTNPILTLAEMAEEIAKGNTPEFIGYQTNSVESEKLHDALGKIINVQKEITDASLEDKKRTAETSEFLEQAKMDAEKRLQEIEQLKVSQAQILKAQEEKLRKNIEDLQVKQTEIVKTHEEALRKNIEQHQATQENVLKAHEEKVRKNLEELQFAKLELQSARVDMTRKESTYLAEIEKLKLGIQKEVLVKKSTFSKFVIPVEVKK